MSTDRTCNRCQRVLPISSFYARGRDQNGNPLGFRGLCRECHTTEKHARTARLAQRRQVNPHDIGGHERMPAAPLLAKFEKHAAPELAAVGLENTCALMGVPGRRIRSWRTDPNANVSLDTADRLLLGLGLLWWEVWPPEQYPAVARIWDPPGYEQAQAPEGLAA